MSNILFCVDADDDRDTERKRKQSHLGVREIVVIALIMAAFLAIVYIVFVRPGIKRTQWVRSQDNVRAIYGALMLYAGDNSDGLPATYLTQEVDRDGYPITWANQLLGYTRHDFFKSPAARSEWDTLLGHRDPQTDERITVNLSYGMLADADTRRTYELRDDVRLLAESIGGGQAGSLNPMPLGDRDGFLIGYNDSNRSPTPDTEFVTRVAFLMRSGRLEPLHNDGVIGIRADGQLLVLPASAEIRVQRRGNLPAGPWLVH